MIKRALGFFAFLLLSFLVLKHISADSSSGTAPSVPSGFSNGPDIVAGNMADLEQFGAVGTQRGLATGITSCNAGNQFVGYFAIPGTDHPAVAQNLYRMSGGSSNNDRFEQIGQSWVKHTFGAKQANSCNFGCQPGGDFTHLGVGCSDTYFSSQSAEQGDLGSRAWINPFTGVFPANARDHTGHNHNAVSHMMIVEAADLNPTTNPGATYYAELVYVTPDEYTWCQTHPGQCNMSNNASYLQYSVSGTTNFSFSQVGSAVRLIPAINAWPGATIKTIEPEPGVDGLAFLAYKVTGPVGGLYHYEYAIYNLNLDRGIQSFSVPRLLVPSAPEGLGPEQNVEFHGPPQQPGFPNDGTQGDAGFSAAPWAYTSSGASLTWNSETLAQNPNANAIRWGTLYNFRFDSTTEPQTSNATIGFFKTGAPVTVEIMGPRPIGGPAPTPTPTPTPTPPTPTPTPLPSATPTPTDPPCLNVVYSENFDDVTPPALPAGWESSAAAGPANCTPSGVCSEGGFWATSTDLPHTGPNAVYHNAPGCVTDSVLDFPATFANGEPFELQFWQSYNLDTNLDGAVLEVSIDGGNFMDIIDAGGTFTRGGYNGTISTGFLSPIAGRQAWTGAAGYSPTGVLVGFAMTAKTVFRFRLATDCSGSGGGWRIDTLRVVSSSTCTPTPTPTGTPTSPPGGTPTPTPTPNTGPAQAINLSTRVLVQSGDGVAIAGFIITGTHTKPVILRGLGPSLAGSGVMNALADPVLELHGPPGFPIVINDNWMDWCTVPQMPACFPPGETLPPGNALESFIGLWLDPGAYTVILRGNGNPVGVGLVEIYDLSPSASTLANISTRAFVGTENDIVVAGFILGSGSDDDQVVVRGLGPSLGAAGLSSILANPTLDLRDSNGVIVRVNNDWQDDPAQAAILTKLGLAPIDNLESGLVATLQPGAYTALLSGVNNGTGLGLVEVYDNPASEPTPSPTPGGTPTPTPGSTPSPTPGACVENFDSVTPPALPPGWVASNPDPGDGVMWVTSTVTPDSAPNDAFLPDQDGISDKVLDSPYVMVNSDSAMLSFRNNFNTEFSGGVFWDCGVLEVSTPSISNGDFLDITDPMIGGSFVSGGYTGEIGPPSPIMGRMGWCGDSGGYIDTVINLGPDLAGQTVTLRWRFISDEAVSAPGWRIDSLSIKGASCP